MSVCNVACALSERKLKKAFRLMIFKNGRLKCPRCGSFRVLSVKPEDRYHCRRCRKKFSLLSATWLASIKVPLTTLVLLLDFWLEDVTVDLAAMLLGLSVPTVRRYYRLFRMCIVKTVEFRPQIAVQVDEAYFGRFKKQANYFHGQKTYPDPVKTCVAGIGCPATGQLATMVVRGKPGQPIKKFIREYVPANLTVYSDGSPIYTRLKATHWHISQTHDLGFANAYYIESCWSWMKRKLFKQYHHFTKKYAREYVSELTFKFNTRKMDKNPLEYLAKSF